MCVERVACPDGHGEDDRIVLIRIAEELGRINRQLETLGISESTGPESPASPLQALPAGEAAAPARGHRTSRPYLPDPRLVRRIIQHRQLRSRFFDAELFADPAWDILLDLAAARAEHRRVSVTSACIASGVPPTTALRWIGHLTEAGLLIRTEDDADRRRAFVALSDKAADAMARYFNELDPHSRWTI